MLYIAIDLKSYYASVECVHRGLDPLTTYLLVADESRSDKTICLAVSPSLKAIGVGSRPRLFEAKDSIRSYEASHKTKIHYIVAVPRMAEYERISALIYSIYLRYVSINDIHVYSIDECFIDATPYLKLYEDANGNESPARHLAMMMINDVIKETGITATVGIGTNLYLAKVAMDIMAKKAQPDEFGVRIAELDEMSYKMHLWCHKPLTAFWQIGPGKARTLERMGVQTMGDLARFSTIDPEWLFKKFGVDAELLIDHAWGKEPCTMADIKAYRPKAHSINVGQVLSRPYNYTDAKLVFSEMIDQLSLQLVEKGVKTRDLYFWVSFDSESLNVCPMYNGPLTIDFYGRLHPAHVDGVVHTRTHTSSTREIEKALCTAFSEEVDHRLLIRRLGVAAGGLQGDYVQMDMFTDYDALEKEERLQRVLLDVRRKYNNNVLLKGKNYMSAGTARERNGQIGGHKA